MLKKEGWNPYMARQVLPFFDAIEKAVERQPDEITNAKPGASEP